MTHRTTRRLATTSVLAAAMLLAVPMSAQVVDSLPDARDPAKVALVRELMDAANFRQQLVRTMRESSLRQGATVAVPPGFWEKFLARAEQDADTLLAPMAADYARYFTASDLRALIAFYKSPAGQRLSLVAPVISANSAYVGSVWGSRVGQEVAGELMRDGAGSTPPSDAQAKAAKKP